MHATLLMLAFSACAPEALHEPTACRLRCPAGQQRLREGKGVGSACKPRLVFAHAPCSYLAFTRAGIRPAERSAMRGTKGHEAPSDVTTGDGKSPSVFRWCPTARLTIDADVEHDGPRS